MKLYCIVSTADGLSVAHYETLDEAVREWLEGMEECPAKERLSMEYGAKGARACLDEAKLMDHEDTEYLWRDGEERVEEVEVDWAVTKDEHERKVDKLECDLQDAIEEKPTKEQRALLDAIEAGCEGHANRLIDCLSAALSEAADRCGYSSPEYKAVDEILTYAAN